MKVHTAEHAPAAGRYRIAVFGAPRTEWRDTAEEAMTDAVAAELASWDGERREHFLAVPVDMETEWAAEG